MADASVSRSATNWLPPDTQAKQREANPARNEAFLGTCQEEHATDANIHMHDLKRAIPKKDTAPGEDRIPYTFLRNAGSDMQATCSTYSTGRTRWIEQYLQGRWAAVRFQGSTSTPKFFVKGTPQGGILSPLLFNILVEQLASQSQLAPTQRS